MVISHEVIYSRNYFFKVLPIQERTLKQKTRFIHLLLVHESEIYIKNLFFVVSPGKDQEQAQFIINSGHLFFMRYHKHVSDI